MSIKSDKWIRHMAETTGMIEPFEPGQIRSRDWKLGDLIAINNEEFLTVEHAERNGWNSKNIYKFSIENGHYNASQYNNSQYFTN